MKILPTPAKLAAYAVALVLVGGSAYGTSQLASAEWDPTTLETTVATQGEQLKNHEDRLKSVEDKTNTNTAAISEVRTAVDSVAVAAGVPESASTTVAPAGPSAPAPKSVVKTEHGYVLMPFGNNANYKYVFLTEKPEGGLTLNVDRVTYDDGSAELLHTMANGNIERLPS